MLWAMILLHTLKGPGLRLHSSCFFSEEAAKLSEPLVLEALH